MIAGRRAARRFAQAEDGGILVLFAVSLGVIFAAMALVWDIGRTLNAATALQAQADRMALEAAAALTGRPGARAAATAAALRDLRGLDPGQIALGYFADLPAAEDAPLEANAASDGEAAFVEVIIQPQTLTGLFAGVAGALTGTEIGATVIAARAVAGRTRIACDIAPLAFCAPENAPYEVEPGRMLRLTAGAQWQPGTLGLLAGGFDPQSDCGFGGHPSPPADFFRCALAITDRITSCFPDRGVALVSALRPGGLADGLNTRFDIYRGSLASQASNTRFAPAPNVVKALAPPEDSGSSCIEDPATAVDLRTILPLLNRSTPLPRDPCFLLGLTCSVAGDGVTGLQLNTYWLFNHGTLRPPAATRFELYLAEIAAAGGGRILPEARSESGAPVCFGGAAGAPARRLLTAAAIDCGAAGFPASGEVAGARVAAFVDLFLTEPARPLGGDGTELWVEEVARAEPGSNGKVHDVVQLYR